MGDQKVALISNTFHTFHALGFILPSQNVWFTSRSLKKVNKRKKAEITLCWHLHGVDIEMIQVIIAILITSISAPRRMMSCQYSFLLENFGMVIPKNITCRSSFNVMKVEKTVPITDFMQAKANSLTWWESDLLYIYVFKFIRIVCTLYHQEEKNKSAWF